LGFDHLARVGTLGLRPAARQSVDPVVTDARAALFEIGIANIRVDFIRISHGSLFFSFVAPRASVGFRVEHGRGAAARESGNGRFRITRIFRTNFINSVDTAIYKTKPYRLYTVNSDEWQGAFWMTKVRVDLWAKAPPSDDTLLSGFRFRGSTTPQ
jgi:hypothetical protein